MAINTLADEAVADLRRDHARLRHQVQNLQALLVPVSHDAAMANSASFIYAQLTATLLPSSSAAATILRWNGTSLETTSKTTTIFDTLNRNFGITGEQFLCRLDRTMGQTEIVGSQGLRRHGSVDEGSGIASGAAGTIEIWTARPPAVTSPLVTVEAYFDFMEGSNSLTDNDEVVVEYYPDASEWFIDEAECP